MTLETELLIDAAVFGALAGYLLGRISPIRRTRQWARDRRRRCDEPGCKRCYQDVNTTGE